MHNRGGLVCVYLKFLYVFMLFERQASKEVIEQWEQEVQQFSQMNTLIARFLLHVHASHFEHAVSKQVNSKTTEMYTG